MIGTKITQSYRIECDHCGASTNYFERLADAWNESVRLAYHYECWDEDGIRKCLCLCQECAKHGPKQPE